MRRPTEWRRIANDIRAFAERQAKGSKERRNAFARARRARLEADKSDNPTNGVWQAGLTKADGSPATTRAEADVVANSIAWRIEDDGAQGAIHAELGIWSVWIPELDAAVLQRDGAVDIGSTEGRGFAELS